MIASNVFLNTSFHTVMGSYTYNMDSGSLHSCTHTFHSKCSYMLSLNWCMCLYGSHFTARASFLLSLLFVASMNKNRREDREKQKMPLYVCPCVTPSLAVHIPAPPPSHTHTHHIFASRQFISTVTTTDGRVR